MSIGSGSKGRVPRQRIQLGAFEENEKTAKEIIPIDYSDAERSAADEAAKLRRAAAALEAMHPQTAMSEAEKKAHDKSLIDRIPKERELLFAFPIAWAAIDKFDVVQVKLRPWIVKKIVEFLGEEEKSLIDFIVSKLEQHTRPQAIVDELKLVLDDDAETFVMKMWRMLAFHGMKLSS